MSPVLGRRLCLVTLLALGILFYIVEQSSDVAFRAASTNLIWAAIVLVGFLFSVFIEGDWIHRPFFSLDYLVSAVSHYLPLSALGRWFPDWWDLLLAVIVGAVVIAMIDVRLVPVLKRLLLPRQSDSPQEISERGYSP